MSIVNVPTLYRLYKIKGVEANKNKEIKENCKVNQFIRLIDIYYNMLYQQQSVFIVKKNNNDPKIIERKNSHLSNDSYMKCVIIYILQHIIQWRCSESMSIYIVIPDDLIFIKLPLLRSLLDNSLGLHTFFVQCFCVLTFYATTMNLNVNRNCHV